MHEFAQQCAENRKAWAARSSSAPAPAPAPRVDTEIDTSTYDAWFSSVFPLSLPLALFEPDARGELVPTPSTKRFSLACALDRDPTPKFPNPAAFRVQQRSPVGPRPSVVSDDGPPTPAFSYGRSPAHSLASTGTGASSCLHSPSSRSSLASVVPPGKDEPLVVANGVLSVRSAFKAACRAPKINVAWLRPAHRS